MVGTSNAIPVKFLAAGPSSSNSPSQCSTDMQTADDKSDLVCRQNYEHESKN